MSMSREKLIGVIKSIDLDLLTDITNDSIFNGEVSVPLRNPDHYTNVVTLLIPENFIDDNYGAYWFIDYTNLTQLIPDDIIEDNIEFFDKLHSLSKDERSSFNSIYLSTYKIPAVEQPFKQDFWVLELSFQ